MFDVMYLNIFNKFSASKLSIFQDKLIRIFFTNLIIFAGMTCIKSTFFVFMLNIF